MSIVRLPIDTKSLYFNIKNDNQRGHTATVATPLKQGASVHEELMQITKIPGGIGPFCREEFVHFKITCFSKYRHTLRGLHYQALLPYRSFLSESGLSKQKQMNNRVCK